MNLLTTEIKNILPKLYATEDIPTNEKVVQTTFFTPWSTWTWYVVEGEYNKEQDDFIFFGLVVGIETEWGYFTLNELSNVIGPGNLKIERDLYWIPTKIKDIKGLK